MAFRKIENEVQQMMIDFKFINFKNICNFKGGILFIEKSIIDSFKLKELGIDDKTIVYVVDFSVVRYHKNK